VCRVHTAKKENSTTGELWRFTPYRRRLYYVVICDHARFNRFKLVLPIDGAASLFARAGAPDAGDPEGCVLDIERLEVDDGEEAA
jgi:hypothetical protein